MKRILTAAVLVFLAVAFGCGASSGGTPPTDYSEAENWLALPSERAHSADVIYFYPTAYLRKGGDKPVICDVNNAEMRKEAAAVFKKQATAFETAADIFAPFYRQADGTYALALSSGARDKLLSGAPLIDAEAALDWYFEHRSGGRPYILAAHSQGANVLRLLLADYMKKHPDRYKLMVAAYVIGYSIDRDFMAANKNLKFAERADDTGVIISYNTEAPTVTGGDPVWLENSISINPISWTRGAEEARSRDNLGSLTKQLADGTLSLDVPGIANARLNLSRGTVVCSSVSQPDYEMSKEMPQLFGSGIYHGWDYGFYYMNIRRNAKERIKAFIDRQSTE